MNFKNETGYFSGLCGDEMAILFQAKVFNEIEEKNLSINEKLRGAIYIVKGVVNLRILMKRLTELNVTVTFRNDINFRRILDIVAKADEYVELCS